MSLPRPPSLLDIPCQVLKIYIANDINIVLTLKQTCKFFNSGLTGTTIQSKLLFSAIYNTDYSTAREIIRKNPEIIFQHLTVLYRNDQKENLSALMFAFKLLDQQMWELFRENLNLPRMQSQFDIQKKLITESFDFNSIFKAYNIFFHNFDEWKQRKFSDEQLKQSWLTLGQKQKELPMHMLKWFCRIGINRNHPNLNLSISETKKNDEFILYHLFHDEKKSLPNVLKELGKTITLISGNETGGYAPPANHLSNWETYTKKAKQDLTNLKKYHKNKLTAFKEFHTEIKDDEDKKLQIFFKK